MSATSGEEAQWFEVYNTRSTDVYLDGLQLMVGEDAITVWDTLLIPASDYGVFGISHDPRAMGGVIPDHAYGWSWIGWEEGQIGLYADSVTVDEVVWDRTFPVTGGASCTLSPLLLDAASNDSGASWCNGATPYGHGDLGTPGAAKDPC